MRHLNAGRASAVHLAYLLLQGLGEELHYDAEEKLGIVRSLEEKLNVCQVWMGLHEDLADVTYFFGEEKPGVFIIGLRGSLDVVVIDFYFL